MKYKIFADKSQRENDRRWELVYEFPTLDEAQGRFDDITGSVELYLGVMKAVDINRKPGGVIYPLYLVEMRDNCEGDADPEIYGEKIDTFEPYIIFDDEFFSSYDIDTNYNDCLVSSGTHEWVVFESSERAGELAADYWREMAENDPKEFACIIGDERLVGWALGRSDSFGISSLDEFCDVCSDHPEEHHASYDGNELEVEGYSAGFVSEAGFVPQVAYRRS